MNDQQAGTGTPPSMIEAKGLSKYFGPFVAVAAVVGTLLVLMIIVGLVARSRFKRVSQAFKGDGA